ncbi:MAG: DUF2460 domain-containing protein [Hyphomicrobiales bacterium]|nr:DUF2460 domain-containing protein [Rickettsiales bacterium]MCP5362268.1 DUF2460 domain-containing protein [Hyphomicrobiales bacterium]
MPASFEEIQFPDDIAYGSSGGPAYSTDVVVLASGHEQRNINWSSARARYNVAHGVKTQTQLDALIAFFRARQGRAMGFRFKDWTDFSATAQVIGTGDGATTQFQLVKTYTSGSVTHTRTITKPVSGTVTVYLDAVEQTSGVTVDTTTGIITFSSAPSGSVVVTADFEFDVPVRFDTDRLSASLDSYGSYSWLDIPLIEVRV